MKNEQKEKGQLMEIDGHKIRLCYSQEQNPAAVQGMKRVLENQVNAHFSCKTAKAKNKTPGTGRRTGRKAGVFSAAA